MSRDGGGRFFSINNLLFGVYIRKCNIPLVRFYFKQYNLLLFLIRVCARADFFLLFLSFTVELTSSSSIFNCVGVSTQHNASVIQRTERRLINSLTYLYSLTTERETRCLIFFNSLKLSLLFSLALVINDLIVNF